MRYGRPKVLILRAPGTNCDAETAYAFRLAGGDADVWHVNEALMKKKKIADFQILTIPGGFSYGDDVGAGKIFANELRFRLGEALLSLLARGGALLGICNGFQVLVKLGLLPGAGKRFTLARQTASLMDNDSGRYEDRWVYLKAGDTPSIFLQGIEKLYLPVAHGEGKFVVEHGAVLRRMARKRQLALTYVDRDGREGVYPWNPNGSVASVAGICDPTGRILGLMPHPERFIAREQHPRWTREELPPAGDGLKLFLNAVAYFS